MAYTPKRLSPAACEMIEAPENKMAFSAASIWEVVIKRGLGRADFRVDPRLLRRGLVENLYIELPVTGEHALAVDTLPPLHKDPFDRLLIPQALTEGLPSVTADRQLADYLGDVRVVRRFGLAGSGQRDCGTGWKEAETSTEMLL